MAMSSDPGTAVGTNSSAMGVDASALGFKSNAGGDFATAVGSSASATGTASSAFGSNSSATAFRATAVGDGAFASGKASSAVGQGSSATGTRSSAFGSDAIASGSASTAIGDGALALGNRSTAIGAGASATQSNQIVLGTDQDVVTIPGLAMSRRPSASTDQFTTVDPMSGNLNSTPFTVGDVANALSKVDDQISSIGAMAAALSAIPNITTGTKKLGCGIGTGVFGGTWAGAAGCVAKIGANVWVNGAVSYTPSVSTAFSDTSSVGARLGLFFQF